MLTGAAIEHEVFMKNIDISEFDKKRLNPNSYNLRLSSYIQEYTDPILDMKKNNSSFSCQIPESGMVLRKGRFYLGSTMESTHTPHHIPLLEGRSSIARLGLFVHVSAGFGDIGFKGTWTLELLPAIDIVVYPGVEICQISFIKPNGYCDELYEGKYLNQTKPEKSKLFKEFIN